jgi:hypothetical protein
MNDVKQKEEAFKNKLSFMKKFLESILSGTTHDEARFFSDFVINCYFECLYFAINKRI